MASRPFRKRGFLALALALLLLAAIVDLLRPGSILLGAWDRVTPGGTRLERTIDRAQRIRPGAQRVNHGGRPSPTPTARAHVRVA